MWRLYEAITSFGSARLGNGHAGSMTTWQELYGHRGPDILKNWDAIDAQAQLDKQAWQWEQWVSIH